MRTAAIAIVMSILFFFVGWWAGRRTAAPKSAPVTTASASATAPAPAPAPANSNSDSNSNFPAPASAIAPASDVFNAKPPRRKGAKAEASSLGVSASLRSTPSLASAPAAPRAIPPSAILAAIERQAAVALPCFSDEPAPPRLLVTIRFTDKTGAPQVSVAADFRAASHHGKQLSSRVRACAERALAQLSFGDLAIDRLQTIAFSLDVADRIAADSAPVATGAAKP